jgi:hypothetical protein
MPLTILDNIDQLVAGGRKSGRHPDGSGKKPTHFVSDKNKGSLLDMHKTLDGKGFKWKSSSTKKPGETVHSYSDSVGNKASITEHASGQHEGKMEVPIWGGMRN